MLINFRSRNTARKSFPPSRLLQIQRQNRRFSVINVPRRVSRSDRMQRRRLYLRTLVRLGSTRLHMNYMDACSRTYPSTPLVRILFSHLLNNLFTLRLQID